MAQSDSRHRAGTQEYLGISDRTAKRGRVFQPPEADLPSAGASRVLRVGGIHRKRDLSCMDTSRDGGIATVGTLLPNGLGTDGGVSANRPSPGAHRSDYQRP
jgi:hypothetical protein